MAIVHDIIELRSLIDANATVKMQDIVDDETDIIGGNLPLISFNIDRIEPATKYYARHRIIYTLRVTFQRTDYDSLQLDNFTEVEKVTDFIYALSLRGYEPSPIEIIKRQTEYAITYLCTMSKEIKSKAC
jgi:hypothetical protein